MELVREVIENNSNISEAARKYRLKISTAKLILKRYKEEGTFFESRKNRRERVNHQNYLT